MQTHNLKIRDDRYRDIVNGIKTFEIRDNSKRDFKINDILVLSPVDDDGIYLQTIYINDIYHVPIQVKVIYIDDYEQKDDYVVLGISW